MLGACCSQLLTVPAQMIVPIDADDGCLRPDLHIERLKFQDPVEVHWGGEWWYLSHFFSLGRVGDVFSCVAISTLNMISASDVCSRGGDREAVILDVDNEKNQIHVHYVGGSQDQDEWVSCEPQGVQLPPMSEKTLFQLAKAKVQEVQ